MGKALDIVVGLLLAAPSVLPVHAQSMASANSADRDPFATLHAEMDRAGSSDFLQLSRLRFLPQETRNYVPAVLSAMQLSGSRDLPIAPMLQRKLATSEVFAVSDARP